MSSDENSPKPEPEEFRPLVYATPADKSTDKAYPNGIRVTFAALWQRWAAIDKGDTGVSTSGEQFSTIYRLQLLGHKLKEKYPLSPPPPVATAKKAGEDFQKFGGSMLTSNKSLKLTYMTLRRAAIVTDLPLGLFILFTNLISQERRAHKKVSEGASTTPKEELLKLVQKIELFAAEARKTINETAEGDDIFYVRYGPGEWDTPEKNSPRDDEEVYIANLEVLKLLRDACKIGDEVKENEWSDI